MSDKDTTHEWCTDRRTYLGALSAAAGAALAGCMGGSTEEHEPGEPVPTLQIDSMTGVTGESSIEQAHLHLAEVLEDELGVPANVSTKEINTMWDEIYNDDRSRHLHLDVTPDMPQFLEPHNVLRQFQAQRAGANGLGNVSQYANCEYTDLVNEQVTISDPDEREAVIQDAVSTFSEDIGTINLFSMYVQSAYRPDGVDIPDDTGDQGVADRNTDLFMEMSPADGDTIQTNLTSTAMQSSTYMVNTPTTVWGTVVYSPLVYFDKNNELQPFLATDWEIEDDATTFRFDIREDATFHNGDPITAEDVQWTFEFVNENTAHFQEASEVPYESIDVIDDHTVEFNFAEPHAPFLRGTATTWGIVPKDVWLDGGAEENPDNVDLDPIVGSGAYQVVNWQRDEILHLEPYDDHWIDTEGELVMRSFEDQTGAVRELEDGDLDAIFSLGSDLVANIEDDDEIEIDGVPGFGDWELTPQHSFPVTQFREFRLALSEAIDREYLRELLSRGNGEIHLHSAPWGEQHPFYPDDAEGLTQIAQSPSGDTERAREILEEAGWTWDDDDRLVYPDDIDTDPRWPQGDEPADHPGEYSCLE
ncbi:ABC transporter substrate-binding protein [Halostagnicola sp. A-GB9-2]|uniref:ABC transporter substrate-binding protein n=1 Tax=Halostagnicola sp. A-GB9-2 TaxID=3048066 RepID=UPI0024BF69DD|nr:ABC transporter substrate-binding protein [Halostagnicola sp. A-GB9-2]MDJ1434384.1 ABC transporter substrate-binding protein [Halostagnicola sp. A-GB9-2]